MKQRIFKIEDYENQESLYVTTPMELSKKYNMYGYYMLDSEYAENLETYKEERNEVFEEFIHQKNNPSMGEVKKFLIEFSKAYTYHACGYYVTSGRPLQLVLFQDSENYYFDESIVLEKFMYSAGEPITEDDLRTITGYEYEDTWDGSNFKEVIYTSDEFDVPYQEVTEEFSNWDELEKIYSSYTGQGTGHLELYIYKDDSGEVTLLSKHISYFQGSEPYYEIDDITEWCLRDSDVREYFEDVEQRVKEYFKSDLKNGEEIILDDGVIAFKYKGELYHFSSQEMCDYLADYNIDALHPVLKAREAIQKRREDKLAQYYQERIEDLPLSRIFVEREDSIQSGNCEEQTDDLIKSTGIEGAFAMRADALLELRNDNYAKRAIVHSYLHHYAHV